MGFGENDKFGHVWDTYDLPVHLGGEVHRLLDLPAVYQPEPDQRQEMEISSKTSGTKQTLYCMSESAHSVDSGLSKGLTTSRCGDGGGGEVTDEGLPG